MTMMTARLVRTLWFTALVLATSAVWAEATDEAAGRLAFGVGNIEAVQADGSRRTLSRGAPIYQGDTVVTGPRARAQILFTDGARMALRPETELRVDDYEFEEAAPPERSRVRMNLSRGGFRTVTGAIAERNRDAYRLSTPFAVIGVRGTDWSAAISDMLVLGVSVGGIFAQNDGGSLDLGANANFNFAQVRSFFQAPEGLDAPPQSLGDVLTLDLGDDGSDAPPAAGDDGTQPTTDGTTSDEDGSTTDDERAPGPPAGDDTSESSDSGPDDSQAAAPPRNGDSGSDGPAGDESKTGEERVAAGGARTDGAGGDGATEERASQPISVGGDSGQEVVIGNPDSGDGGAVFVSGGGSARDEAPVFEIGQRCL